MNHYRFRRRLTIVSSLMVLVLSLGIGSALSISDFRQDHEDVECYIWGTVTYTNNVTLLGKDQVDCGLHLAGSDYDLITPSNPGRLVIKDKGDASVCTLVVHSGEKNIGVNTYNGYYSYVYYYTSLDGVKSSTVTVTD